MMSYMEACMLYLIINSQYVLYKLYMAVCTCILELVFYNYSDKVSSMLIYQLV